MLYFILMITSLVGIIIFGNRYWVKRRVKKENLIYGILTIGLIILLVCTIVKFIEYKNNIKKTDFSKYTNVFEEKGKFYTFGENGNMIANEMTIGELLSDYFIKDIFDGRTDVKKEEALKNNIIVVSISAIIFVYWLTLLVLYEKEDNINYEQLEDFKLLEKYNPMIAGCIAQNRNIMGRDIIAVILNFIENKKIILRVESNNKNSKIKYRYMISENKEAICRMDMIEKTIYDWLFEGVEDFVRNKVKYDYIKISEEGIIEIDLIKRIKSFSAEEDTYSKIEELRYMAKGHLKRLGANNASVPFLLKIFNDVLMFFILLITGNHVLINGLEIVMNNVHVIVIAFIAIFLISILPIIYFFSLLVLKIIKIFFKNIEEATEKHTGRNLISKSISIMIAITLLIGIVLLLPIDTYLVYDILAIGVGFLVIQTDNYMLKHKSKILTEYYNLKRIENKIQDYSLLKEKNIEHMKLWGKYYPYSVALGIPIEVNKESYLNYNIEANLIIDSNDLQSIYHVCKSYLEVMWDFEFDNKKTVSTAISYLRKKLF